MIKFFKVLLKVIGWILVFIAVFGGLATFSRNFMDPFFYVAILLYLIPGWLCFWGSRKLAKLQNKKAETSVNSQRLDKVDSEIPIKQNKVSDSDTSTDFSKEELSALIYDCDKLAALFSQSPTLTATCNGRSVKMVQTMMSYKCIFIYLYSSVLRYGSANTFLQNDTELSGRYAVSCSMVFNNPQARANCFLMLPSNWKDVIRVLDSMRLAGEWDNVCRYDSTVDAMTKAFSKISTLK